MIDERVKETDEREEKLLKKNKSPRVKKSRKRSKDDEKEGEDSPTKVQIEKTEIVANEEGKLLDHNGEVIELRYPLSKDYKRKLFRELKDYLQPIASEAAEY